MGPSWFTQVTPCETIGIQIESIEIWRDYLIGRLLPSRLCGKETKVYLYQSKLVYKQLSLAQMLVVSDLSSIKEVPSSSKRLWSSYKVLKKKINSEYCPFSFVTCFYTTLSFETWWKNKFNNVSKPFNNCFKYIGDHSSFQTEDLG